MPVSQLRIAMLSVHSCPLGNLGAKDTGGMSVYIRELARELGKQGHLVDVYTRVHDSQDRQIYDLGQNARLIHLRAGGDEEIHKLVVYSHLPDFACNLENFRSSNDLRYDLVFSHYWLSAWVGEIVAQWWSVPHLTIFHTLGAVKNNIGLGEVEPELRIQAERDLARNCHHVIATTEREKEALIKYYGASPERIGVVPCGVNMELFQPVDKGMTRRQLGLGDDKLILYVGRIEPLKGVDQLIEAMQYLQNGQGPRLVVVGGDENSRHEMDRLRELSRDFHTADSITFSGRIKHEELPYFYSAADVCVVPSYYESFGLVALEALACGTPVVATDVGDLKHVIREGETGYIVMDNSPRSLADSIALFLSRQRDARTAELIRASVSRFGWPNIAEAITEVCRMLLAKFYQAGEGEVIKRSSISPGTETKIGSF